jgi:hypothetical protein
VLSKGERLSGPRLSDLVRGRGDRAPLTGCLDGKGGVPCCAVAGCAAPGAGRSRNWRRHGWVRSCPRARAVGTGRCAAPGRAGAAVGAPVSAADRSRARERRPKLGEVPPEERAQLAARFGTVLRTERGIMTQQQLADLVGFDRSAIVRWSRGGGGRRRRASGNWPGRCSRGRRCGIGWRWTSGCAGRGIIAAGLRAAPARSAGADAAAAAAGDGPVVGDNYVGWGALVVAELARSWHGSRRSWPSGAATGAPTLAAVRSSSCPPTMPLT